MSAKAIIMSVLQAAWAIFGIIFLINNIFLSEELIFSEYLDYELGFITYVVKGGIWGSLSWFFAIWGVIFAFAIPQTVFDNSECAMVTLSIGVFVYTIIIVLVSIFTPLKFFQILHLIVIGFIAFAPAMYCCMPSLDFSNIFIVLIVSFSFLLMFALFTFPIAFLFRSIMAGIIADIIIIGMMLSGAEAIRENITVLIFKD